MHNEFYLHLKHDLYSDQIWYIDWIYGDHRVVRCCQSAFWLIFVVDKFELLCKYLQNNMGVFFYYFIFIHLIHSNQMYQPPSCCELIFIQIISGNSIQFWNWL